MVLEDNDQSGLCVEAYIMVESPGEKKTAMKNNRIMGSSKVLAEIIREIKAKD